MKKGVREIRIHADRTVEEVHNFWNNIHFHPTDGIEDSWGKAILDRISADHVAQYVRIYAMLEDIVSRDEEGKLCYDFRETDYRIDYMVEKGFRLLICFNFLPVAIAAEPKAMSWLARYKGKHINTSEPADYGEWEEVCRAYTEHLAKRYGTERLGQWYFHCWNEPDLPNYFLAGTQRENHMEEVADAYCKLYDHFAEGVKRACCQVKIGGPSAALSNRFIERFLTHVKEGVNWANGGLGSQIDFFSVHTYGTFPERLAAGEDIRIEDTYNRVLELKEIAQRCGWENLEMVVDEWGLSTEGFTSAEDCPELEFRNTELYGAAFAHLINYYSRHHAPVSRQMICLSGQHNLKWDFHGYRSFFTLNGFPKPIYNAYALCGKLGNLLLESDHLPEDGRLSVFPTVDTDGRIAVLVSYFLPQGREKIRRCVEPVHIRLELEGLMGRYLVRHYRIDHENCNAYTAWCEMGRSRQLDQIQRERILETGRLKEWYPQEMITPEGFWQLDIVMTRNAVSLLELEPVRGKADEKSKEGEV